MKPRILAVLAGLASLAFAWWLLQGPHTSRELFLCMIAWVLGFWVASGVRGSAPAAGDEDAWEEEDEEG